MNRLRHASLTVLLSAGIASAATATDFTTLREDARVHQTLLGASVAYLIEKACPTISRRKVYGLSQVLKLRKYARSLGYSNDEMKAYINSRDEQDRFRAIAEPYLAGLGAVADDSESYCVAGRAEIAAGTIAGSLLDED